MNINVNILAYLNTGRLENDKNTEPTHVAVNRYSVNRPLMLFSEPLLR